MVKEKKITKGVICPSCGILAAARGHLCTPVDLDAYTCDYCNKQAKDPRHVCVPKKNKFKFICDTCGRVSVQKNELCKPKKIV